MIDSLLALVPVYGLWILVGTVVFACLAIPLPASMLVLVSGSFAAAGDLDLWQVLATVFVAYATGDQLAYRLARIGGPPLIARLRRRKRMDLMIGKAEMLLSKHGIVAIFLSRTLFSPVGPYVSYLCGAAKLHWHQFTLASLVGACCWTAAYVMLGYAFADRIADVAIILSDGLGIIAAAAAMMVLGHWLRINWRRYKQSQKAEPHVADTKSCDGSNKDPRQES